jgi:hypothetical protein
MQLCEGGAGGPWQRLTLRAGDLLAAADVRSRTSLKASNREMRTAETRQPTQAQLVSHKPSLHRSTPVCSPAATTHSDETEGPSDGVDQMTMVSDCRGQRCEMSGGPLRI